MAESSAPAPPKYSLSFFRGNLDHYEPVILSAAKNLCDEFMVKILRDDIPQNDNDEERLDKDCG